MPLKSQNNAVFVLVSALVLLLAIITGVSLLWSGSDDRASAARKVDRDGQSIEPNWRSTETAGHSRRPATDPASSQPVEEAGPLLIDCMLLDDPEERKVCLRRFLEAWGPEAPQMIGAYICAGIEDRAPGGIAAVLAECIRYWQHDRLLDALDSVQQACPSWSTGDYIKNAVLELLRTDPWIADALRSEISPESLYQSNRTEMAVVLAAELALASGDASIRPILVDGATGALGGTVTQIDLSSLVVVRLLEQPADSLDLVADIVSSPHLPKGVGPIGMGSSLIHILTTREVLSDAEESTVIASIVSVLDHPILGKSAALHIIDQLQDPPWPISKETWANVLAHAEMIKELH